MINTKPEAWIRTGKLLKRGVTNTKRKSIDEMNLTEALDAEKKYLRWYDKYPEHEDRTVKKHIYTNYLLPHIEVLKKMEILL